MSKLEDLEQKYKELGEEIEKLKKEKENKVWKPLYNEDYYCINACGNVFMDSNNRCDSDDQHIEFGNCFKTYEEAQKVAEKIRIYTELKRYAKEHDGKFAEEKERYYITFNRKTKEIGTDFWYNHSQMWEVYFSSRELAEQAIKDIGEEKLKKLFE